MMSTTRELTRGLDSEPFVEGRVPGAADDAGDPWAGDEAWLGDDWDPEQFVRAVRSFTVCLLVSLLIWAGLAYAIFGLAI